MEKVVKAIAEHLGIDVSKVVPGASLVDDLNADDFDIVEMTIAIQNAIGVKISEQEEAEVVTVGDFIKLVESKSV